MKKIRVSADLSKRINSLWKYVVTAKQRRVDRTLLHKWV